MTLDCRRTGLNLVMIAMFTMVLNSAAEPTSRLHLPYTQVCKDKDHCILAEIADTSETRLKGLMFRDNLPESRGMLFVYPQSNYWNFWMKNTKMPLDIIWLDKTGRVVDIVNKAPPCMREPCRIYVPREKAAYVLELASDMSKKWRLNIGDLIIFELP